MFRVTLCLLCLMPQLALAKLKCPPPSERFQYDRIILNAAKKHKVDAALVFAVIKQESCFNRLAVSPAGAEGLMQLIPATAERFNVSNSFNPSQNINAGTKYLAWLLKRFKGNLRFAIAGYNAGEGKVDLYKGIPPYRETRHYVKRVMSNYRQFKGLKSPSKKRQKVFIAKAKKKPYSGLEGRLRKANDNTPSGLHFNRNTWVKAQPKVTLVRSQYVNRISTNISSPTIVGKRIRVRSATLTKVKTKRKGYTRVYSKQSLARLPNAS